MLTPYNRQKILGNKHIYILLAYFNIFVPASLFLVVPYFQFLLNLVIFLYFDTVKKSVIVL